jgi:ABC transporter substrate binding protein (PQQ-dependent alcohol dehydrogenase system)
MVKPNREEFQAMRVRHLAAALAIALTSALPARAEPDFGPPPASGAFLLKLAVTHLTVERDTPPTLSNLDPIPEDLALAGSRLALTDNRTTGRFLGHGYALTETFVPLGEDRLAAARAALAESPYLILDTDAATLTAIADLPEAKGALLFNATAADTELRSAGCRPNLFHTLPDHAMRADALMQFVTSRRWTRLALIRGANPEDQAFAAALTASTRKFGLKPPATKDWLTDADIRRNAAQEVPLFTQSLPEHDLLLIADEAHDFGRYIAYNTWAPRPVAGSEGLVPTAWAPVVEQWGAAQLQSRFSEATNRQMRAEDWSAWAAFRALSEAMTRTNATDPATLRQFLLSEDFELAAFKGAPLSFRNWNGQLRQPIPLVTPRAVVAQAPLEGFLHQRNELDSLGEDAPETKCKAFRE